MLTRVVTLLLCSSVFASSDADRSEVTYPSLETLRSGMKMMRVRAFGRDIVLRLELAGDIISDDFVVMDFYGNIEETDVKGLKSKLYKDRETGAALYIDDDGSLEINGIINSKLKIEPYESEEMVKNGIKAHVITESSAKRKKPVNDAKFTQNPEKVVEVARDFDESQCVLIKYLCITDSTFSAQFKNSTKKIQVFLGKVLIKAQEMIDTLKLNIKIVMIGVIVLTDDPPYVRQSLIPTSENTFDVRYIRQNVSNYYCTHTENPLVVEAQIIIFITSRALGQPRPDKTVFDGILGVAFLGGVCEQCTKYAIIHGDRYDVLDTADTFAHESAHVIGCPHDGDGPEFSVSGSPTGAACPGKWGYIMGDDYGKNKTTFSSCSRENIVYFLGLSQASCIVGDC